jgi:hypothetical protein
MKYSLDKYRFYQAGNKVIAVSTYAGKAVRGVAKTDPSDEFDFEKGKKLAAARCNAKVAEKRYRRAKGKIAEAETQVKDATRFYDKMRHYYEDSWVALNSARKDVQNIVDEL